MANGGRIVNISSVSARFFWNEIRYGCSKAALSYFSHVLRMEIGPRFGIWVSTVEPGFYKTNVMRNALAWSNRVTQKLKEENKIEIMEMYDFDLEMIEKLAESFEKGEGGAVMQENISQVVDCVIHGLTAKYPKRRYEPGWDPISKFLAYSPLWMTEPFMMYANKKQLEDGKRLLNKS